MPDDSSGLGQQRESYRPYPIDLVGELEDLLHERARHVQGQAGVSKEKRDRRIPEILTELSNFRAARAGDVVAGAELLSIIDSGDFGTVWRGLMVHDRRPCAVKVFHPEGLGKGRMTREFRQGVGAMRALTKAGPPDTMVQLFDHDEAQLAFSMTLVEGGDLRNVDTRGWTLAKKVDVFRELCAAVKFAHDHRVIHRDLKPANVLIGKRGQAVLTDFDLADLLTLGTLTARSPGSLAYAAPEQLEPPRETDHAPRLVESDIYSLGRILYYLVVGVDPSGVFRQEVPQLPELVAQEGIRRIVRRCTLKDPAKRYRSVDELLADLSRHEDEPRSVGCELPGEAPTHSLHEIAPQVVPSGRLKGKIPLYRHPSIVAAYIGAAALLVTTIMILRKASGSTSAEGSAPAKSARVVQSNTTTTISLPTPSAAPSAALVSDTPCPEACCKGVPCEQKLSCEERVKCQLCRDPDPPWVLSLRHLALESQESWSDVLVCVSVGNQCAEQCVLAKEVASPFSRFECEYRAKSFVGGYVRVLGKNLAGVTEPIAQGRFSFRIGAEASCSGLLMPKLDDRNGHVVSLSMSIQPKIH